MKKFLAIILAATLAVSVVGCGKKEADKDTFIMAIDADPTNVINPVTTSDRFGLMTVNVVFSQLYKFNSNSDLDYKLADEIEVSDDSLTYTVKLKEDVKWHDGEDFTAEDVVFTFNTLIDNEQSEQSGPLQFGGEKVVVNMVDDYTVEFVLKSAKPNALEVFGAAYIMPEHIYKDVTDFGTSTIVPVGTGPYKYSEYNEAETTIFEANKDYFDGAPKIEKLIFKVIESPETRVLAMKNGEIDGVAVSVEDLDKLDDSVSINPYSEGRIGYLSFNFNYSKNEDLVNDINFRKAIMYAINKEDVIEATYESDEYADNPASFLPSTALYTTDDVEKYGIDLDKAKEYLAKTDGKGATLSLGYVSGNVDVEKTATVIQDNLKELDITLELKVIDPNAMYKALGEGNAEFDLFLGGYIMGIDPDAFSPLFMSDSAINYSGYSNSDVDKLFSEGIAEVDDEKRGEIYAELQEVFMDDAFFLPLYENKRIVVLNGDVEGVDDAGFAPIYTFNDWSKLSFK